MNPIEPSAESEAAQVSTPGPPLESRRERAARRARRGKLYTYAILAAALFIFIVALVVANTRHVKVSWVFGSTRQSLVWVVLAAAILGWLLGILTSVIFRRRTRAPRA